MFLLSQEKWNFTTRYFSLGQQKHTGNDTHD
jgi:hypothetical protein